MYQALNGRFIEVTTIGERSLGRSKGDRGLFIFFVSWTVVRVKDIVKDVLFSLVLHQLCRKKKCYTGY